MIQALRWFRRVDGSANGYPWLAMGNENPDLNSDVVVWSTGFWQGAIVLNNTKRHLFDLLCILHWE